MTIRRGLGMLYRLSGLVRRWPIYDETAECLRKRQLHRCVGGRLVGIDIGVLVRTAMNPLYVTAD